MRKFKSLNNEAYLLLREIIYSDKSEKGKIYSETKTAENLGFSRTPVRDAIHRLESEGLIDVIPSKGFILHKVSPEEILLTFQERTAIEGYSAFMLSKNKTGYRENIIIKKLTDAVNAHERLCLENAEINSIVRADQEFHKILINYMNNSNFNLFFDKHLLQLFKHSVSAIESSQSKIRMVEHHRLILNKLIGGTPMEVYTAIVEHLEDAKEINYIEAQKNIVTKVITE
ncbi:MAG: GntR family transcriptional regulator [Anaerotignaceae bacterium]